MQADGRITVNLDSKLSQVFARLVDTSPIDETSDAPPPVYEETEPWSLCLNIVLLIVGSRGDVQPFLAMGNGLQRYGHRVRIATHAVFKDFVQAAGLEFYPIGGDPAQLMAYMVKNPGLIPNMKSLREGEIGTKRRMVQEMMQGCWSACIEPDPDSGIPFVANAIIANPPTFAHIHCAQALSVPLHMVFTMPWSPTKAFPHPLANVRNTTTDEKLANYLSFSLVNALTWQGLGDVINDFRTKILGLEEVPLTEGPFLAETLKIPYTYCWSPALIPKPRDWRDHLDVTGFIFRSLPSYEPPPELDSFLKSGPAPLYVGFGSIVVEKPHVLLNTILAAVGKSGVRCIISKGWSSLTTDEIPKDVMFVGECPHEWLFHHTFAVVHHGGAGTTAAGLNAGKPTIVVPFFGDQPFWGDMVAKSGAGPSPIPHSQLTAENLATAIEFCKTSEVSQAAQAVADKMQAENGVERAVDSFHKHLRVEELRCDLVPTLPAVFEYTKSRKLNFKRAGLDTKVVKLSGLAAEALEKAGKIDLKGIRTYRPNVIIIENRRWDPLTSFTSAGVGLGYDVLKETNGLWYAPYKMHSRRGKSTSSAASFVSDTASVSDIAETSTPAGTKEENNALVTAKYAGASAASLPKIFGVMSKGVLVDLPFAMAEGLRATPKLYGETVKDHEPITNVKTGLKVAGKDFVTGMSTGLVDLFVQPYKGAVNNGAAGFAAGVGKGTIGSATKMAYAVTGLYSYPAQGIWRSIHAASHSNTKKGIMSARRIHNIYFARSEAGQISDAAIVEAFDKL
jgi:UDP:flavonoid glycosyltransferase YjiC (YdhE family)